MKDRVTKVRFYSNKSTSRQANSFITGLLLFLCYSVFHVSWQVNTLQVNELIVLLPAPFRSYVTLSYLQAACLFVYSPSRLPLDLLLI